MAIEPVEGIVMGAVQAAANAKANADYDKKLREAMERHAETVAIADENLYNHAIERTGGAESLGWLYSGSIGSYRIFYTKQEYLQKVVSCAFLYDAELGGWNKEWGDQQKEIAKAKRAYRARRDPQNAEKILATPLEEFYLVVKHWERPWERQERIKREQEEAFWNSLWPALWANIKVWIYLGLICGAVKLIFEVIIPFFQNY